MIELRLKKYAEKRISTGGLWVFSNELQEIVKCEPGEIVRVFDNRNFDYGLAFYNPNSLIAVRLLSTRDAIDKEFFKKRIADAFENRRIFLKNEQAYRLVFGESDLLPGLIIDKYGDYYSVQFLSIGMDKMKSEIVAALTEVFPETKGVIEKGDSHIRTLEGLPALEEVLFGTVPETIEIVENDIKLEISLKEGQKTGYFLDQKFNRLAIKGISTGAKVLDCFCNQGGFALNAAKAGAEYTLGIDSSKSAIECAKNNAKINGFAKSYFQVADVFEFLEKEAESTEKWDVIVLDPPAFAKTKKTVATAIAGYARINRLAMKSLKQNGFLVTSSCSFHLTENDLIELVAKEAGKLGKKVKMVYNGGQSPDHPFLLSMPETKYLKFFILQVV